MDGSEAQKVRFLTMPEGTLLELEIVSLLPRVEVESSVSLHLAVPGPFVSASSPKPCTSFVAGVCAAHSGALGLPSTSMVVEALGFELMVSAPSVAGLSLHDIHDSVRMDAAYNKTQEKTNKKPNQKNATKIKQNKIKSKLT